MISFFATLTNLKINFQINFGLQICIQLVCISNVMFIIRVKIDLLVLGNHSYTLLKNKVDEC